MQPSLLQPPIPRMKEIINLKTNVHILEDFNEYNY
jgi:hypothetical protein